VLRLGDSSVYHVGFRRSHEDLINNQGLLLCMLLDGQTLAGRRIWLKDTFENNTRVIASMTRPDTAMMLESPVMIDKGIVYG
jgi:hypothetical protein